MRFSESLCWESNLMAFKGYDKKPGSRVLLLIQDFYLVVFDLAGG